MEVLIKRNLKIWSLFPSYLGFIHAVTSHILYFQDLYKFKYIQVCHHLIFLFSICLNCRNLELNLTAAQGNP